MSIGRYSTTVLLLIALFISVVEAKVKYGDLPDLTVLRHFPVKDGSKNIDIVTEIQNDYKHLGGCLLEDASGNKVAGIERHKRDYPDEITVEILRQWLQGKGKEPVTWWTLVECLREANLKVAAGYIVGELSQDGRSNVPVSIGSSTGQQQEVTSDAGKLSVDQIIIIVGFSIIAGILILILCWITKKGGSVYIEKLFATFADHGAKVGTDNVNVDVKGNVAQGDFANLGVGKNQQGIGNVPSEGRPPKSDAGSGDKVETGVEEHSTRVRVRVKATMKRDSTPTMRQLKKFPGKGGSFNILQRIGANYKDFGIFLLKDDDGAKTSAIVKQERGDVDEINQAIFQKWIDGKGMPCTWKILVECLRDIDLNSLANDIDEVLED